MKKTPFKFQLAMNAIRCYGKNDANGWKIPSGTRILV
jgi:hypothetical protein